MSTAPSLGDEAPSRWVQRWSHLVPAGANVLDVACGRGRHVRWFAARGAVVTAVDRDAAAVEPLRRLGEIVVADIEAGPWPFAGRRFDAVVVTHYLWRDRLPDIVDSVGPDGVLIYETFAIGQETIGRPSRAEFLLRAGELLEAVAPLRPIAFEDGYEPGDPDDRGHAARAPGRFVQRIVAVREASGAHSAPRRHALSPAGPDGHPPFPPGPATPGG